jgi:hypothetical protein
MEQYRHGFLPGVSSHSLNTDPSNGLRWKQEPSMLNETATLKLILTGATGLDLIRK